MVPCRDCLGMPSLLYSPQDAAKSGQREAMNSVLGPHSFSRDGRVLMKGQDITGSPSLRRGEGRSLEKFLGNTHTWSPSYGMPKEEET